MTTARVFKSGNSQALRLPKQFRFTTSEVEIFRRGDEVVLRARAPKLSELLARAPAMPRDFPEDLADPPPQKRRWSR